MRLSAAFHRGLCPVRHIYAGLHANDRRQAERIRRHAKHAERILFALIDDMGNSPPGNPAEWEGALNSLEQIDQQLSFMVDLVSNSLAESLKRGGL